MLVEIWDGDNLLAEMELRTFEKCGDLYIRWRGEPRRIYNNREVWLTGNPPSKKSKSKPQGPCSPVPEKPLVPPTHESEPDTFFDNMQKGKSTEIIAQVKPVTSTTIHSWDHSQRDVIQTAKSARLLVGAGPGTGKTAVACARVAYLVNEQECSPNNIFLISFTRTAVAEIRERIACYLDDPFFSNNIKILTLDSFAWSINSGFNDGATLANGYDGNIATATAMLLKHPLVSEYLQAVQHLIVDEAQDIIGERASLVISIIDHLHTEAGFTVFSDDAQAIYGFSVKNDIQNIQKNQDETLPQQLRKQQKISCEKHLKEIHRTTARGLVEIFSTVRDIVLGGSEHPLSKYGTVCEQIRKNARSNADTTFDPLHFSAEDNSFALFRWKREVLKAADALGSKPHRIRMGGIGSGIVPWIGAVLGGVGCEKISKDEFSNLWEERKIDTHFANMNQENAWRDLLEVAGDKKRVALDILQKNITTLNLPHHMLKHELGSSGPIIGTIHAAKGRETDTVYLYFPKLHHGSSIITDYDEETRVMFVGATRAKNNLHTRMSFEYIGGDYSGRISEYVSGNKYHRRIMFGLKDDINFSDLVGKNIFKNIDDVQRSQDNMLYIAKKINETHCPIQILAIFNGKYYELQTEEGHILCSLSNSVQTDIYKILKKRPQKIDKLWLMDIGTLAVDGKAPDAKDLYEPWQNGGIMLYPRFIGYPELAVKRS